MIETIWPLYRKNSFLKNIMCWNPQNVGRDGNQKLRWEYADK